MTQSRVAILHASNANNIGSLMMVANLIHYHEKQNPGCEYLVDNESQDGLSRIRDASGVQGVLSLSSAGVPDPARVRQRSLRAVKALLHLVDAILLGPRLRRGGVGKVVILGGDDLSEYYSKLLLLLEFLRLASLAVFRVPVSLVGQTIGPFSGWREHVARYLLRWFDISARDPVTEEYLRKTLRLQRVRRTADLALLDLRGQSNSASAAGPANQVVVVPSGLWRAYTDDYDAYIASWASIVRQLADTYDVLMLPHVVSSATSDEQVIHDVSGALGTVRHTLINGIALPVEARDRIGASRFTVSGRMHACISSLQCGKPSVAVSYSVKYRGVLGELGQSRCIVEAADFAAWRSGAIPTQVMSRVAYIEANYDGLCAEIRAAVSLAKADALREIEGL